MDILWKLAFDLCVYRVLLQVECIRLPTDTDTQRLKGFGYAEFKDVDNLLAAVHLNAEVSWCEEKGELSLYICHSHLLGLHVTVVPCHSMSLLFHVTMCDCFFLLSVNFVHYCKSFSSACPYNQIVNNRPIRIDLANSSDQDDSRGGPRRFGHSDERTDWRRADEDDGVCVCVCVCV